MSEITQFKQYVETELEKRINELPDLGYDLPEIRKYKKRVASATFAYENEEVIDWLRNRGYYIRTEQWVKLEKINQQIQDVLTTEDSTKLDKFQRPTSVFVTWQTEEGYNRALTYNDPVLTNEYCSKGHKMNMVEYLAC